MAEPRRIDLKTLETSNKDDKKDKARPTLRFNLALTESNDKTCPEFSYVELLKNALGEQKDGKEDLDPNDPFAAKDAAEHDKMVALAKSFEQKYGMNKGAGRIRDLVDLGEGYDETDAFIDNSEAYDEIVPATLTTKLGGFYINSGVLDFREVSDDSADEFQGKAKKKRRKMRITSDDESEDGRKKKIKKRKFKDGEDGEMKKKKKKKLSSSTSEDPNGVKKVFKKRGRPPKIKPTSPTVPELLKQQSISTSGMPMGADSNRVPNGSVMNGDSNGRAYVNSKETLANIEACINAVASGTDEENRMTENTDLPSGLPSDTLDIIDRIKKAVKMSTEGKTKVFTHSMNNMLLDLELKARKLQCGIRSSIYSHLATFFPCNKDTIVKRAKKLRLNQQDNKLKEPIQKLQQAISRVMPSLLEKYTVECQNAVQKRYDRLLEEKKEKVDSQDGPKEDGGSSDSDDEDKVTNEESGKKRIMNPRKKFQWNDELRSLLNDVVRIKMSMFDTSKLQCQSAEDYLKAFLDAEIKTLWPKGWIQTRMLFKESRSVHSKWTTPGLKPKKTVIVTRPVTPSHSVTTGATNNLSSSNNSSQDEGIKMERVELSPPGGAVSSKPMLPPVTVTSSAGVMSLLDYAEAGSSSSVVTTTTASPSLSHVLSPSQGTSPVPSSSNKLGSNSMRQISPSAAEEVRQLIQAAIKTTNQESSKPSLPANASSVMSSKPSLQQQSPGGAGKQTTSEANTFLMQFQKFAGSRYPAQMASVTPQVTVSAGSSLSQPKVSVKTEHATRTASENSSRQQQHPVNSSGAMNKVGGGALKLPSPRTLNPNPSSSTASTSSGNISLGANFPKFASPTRSVTTAGKPQTSQAFSSPNLEVKKNAGSSSSVAGSIQRSHVGGGTQPTSLLHRSAANGSQESLLSNKSLYEALSSAEGKKSVASVTQPRHPQVTKTTPSGSAHTSKQQQGYHVKTNESSMNPKRHPAVMQGSSSSRSASSVSGGLAVGGLSTQSRMLTAAAAAAAAQKSSMQKPLTSSSTSLSQISASVMGAQNIRQSQKSPQLQEKGSAAAVKSRSTASPTLNILGGITLSQLKKDAEMLAQQNKSSQSSAFQQQHAAAPSSKALQKQGVSSMMSSSGLQLARPTPVTPVKTTWTMEELHKFLSSPTPPAFPVSSSSSSTTTVSLPHSSQGYQGLHLVGRSGDTSNAKSSGDAIITGPAPGTYIHGHQRQSPGSATSPMSASPHHVHSPQTLYAANVHASSPRQQTLAPSALPFGHQYSDPSQQSHRY